jgi:putative peptidoglycan lipid II flippase
MASGLRLTMAILVPAAAGYALVAHPLMQLVFHHGHLSAHDANRVATVVTLFAIGLPGFSFYLLLMRGYQAMKDTRSMFWLYAFENAVTVVLALALYPVMGVKGLALGWVGAYTIGSLVAFFDMRRRTDGLEGAAFVAVFVRSAVATAVMALPVLAIEHVVPSGSTVSLAAQVLLGAVVGVVMYVVLAHLMRISELTDLWRTRGISEAVR